MITRNKKIIYSLAFLIPTLIMLCSCIVNKIYPFGNDTILISDCNGQYVDYFSYFKNIFTSNNNFLYTFSKNLGGDMIGLYAYYLASPLNIILLFFNSKSLPVGILIIVLIKIGLSGLTFNFLISKESKYNYLSLLFSTAYALTSYNMAYFFNLMWLDGVILLPLIIMGINQLFKNNFYSPPYLYMISLCAAIITNYYIGFMLCVFSFIYFIYKLFLSTDKFIDLKLHSKKIYSYIAFSLIAVGLSCFILIPTFISLLGGKAKFDSSELLFEGNYKFIDVFAKLFTSSITSGEFFFGLPNIFSGVMVTVLIILYFMNSNIILKEKLLSLGILSVLLISFHINTVNLMWHGLNSPIGFPYRYSFMFSFLLIYFAYKSFLNLSSGINCKQIVSSFFIFLTATIIIFRRDYEFSNIKWVYFDLFLFAVIAFLFYMYSQKNTKRICVILIALINFLNLSINSVFCILKAKRVQCSTIGSYTKSIDQISDTVETLKNLDNSFYRLEKTFFRTLNDSMQFSYNGMTHFSSCEKDFIKDFMGKMGFRNNKNSAAYNDGSTVAAESLLGLKYLLSKKKVNKPYEKIIDINKINVFKNPYALPISFVANKKILDISINKKTNPFIIQNNIWGSLADNNLEDIFTEAEVVNISTDNLIAYEKRDGSTKYKKVNSSLEGSIDYKIKINKDQTLYAYLSAPNPQKADMFLNRTNLGTYFNTTRWNVLNMGKFKNGETVNFSIKLKSDNLVVSRSFFYYENIDVLKDYHDKLSNGFCNVEKITSSHLKIKTTIPEDNKQLLFTIPYETNWNITIDGKKVEKKKTFDALMSINITKGDHVIELKYIPSGLYLGIAISILSLLILIMIILRNREQNRISQKKVNTIIE